MFLKQAADPPTSPPETHLENPDCVSLVEPVGDVRFQENRQTDSIYFQNCLKLVLAERRPNS